MSEETKENPIEAKPPRKIILSPKADIVRTDEAGEKTTTESNRAVFVLLDAMNSMPDTGTYEIYVKEDEEKSDIPGQGEERFRRRFTPEDNMSKTAVMKFLANNYMDPRQCVLEFQKLCTVMAMHSQLKNIMITMTFDGARPSGFTFFTDCADQTNADIEALGNASLKMANGYIADMKKQHPNEVSFESDGDIILPNSVDVGKLARSAAAAQKLMKAKAEGK
jgi:hypothetical protein